MLDSPDQVPADLKVAADHEEIPNNTPAENGSYQQARYVVTYIYVHFAVENI